MPWFKLKTKQSLSAVEMEDQLFPQSGCKTKNGDVNNNDNSYASQVVTNFAYKKSKDSQNPIVKSAKSRRWNKVEERKNPNNFFMPQPISSIPPCSNLSEFLKFRVRLSAMDNLNPKLHKKSEARVVKLSDYDESVVDEIDAREVFDMIRDINDPEHPLTLEELNVVEEDKVFVDNANNQIKINFTPTIPHCSMATLIGLAIRVQLMRSLPNRFKVDVSITPGAHASESAINKQLADKERVAAALENSHLIEVVNQCLAVKGY